MGREDFIRLRRDTAAQWASVNPVLGSGEPGIETDTNKGKIGDGVTPWNSLAYFPSGATGTIAVEEGNVTVDASVDTLDFDASDFNITSDGPTEVDITLNYGTGAGQPAEGNHTHTGGAAGFVAIAKWLTD